jgi:hypothetical protein
MHHLLPHKAAGMPRKSLFWAVVGTLALGQLLAIWLLCSGQVRRAEVQDAMLQVQRMAVTDCLHYVPKATLHGCEKRVGSNSRIDGVGGKAGAMQPSVAAPMQVAHR